MFLKFFSSMDIFVLHENRFYVSGTTWYIVTFMFNFKVFNFLFSLKSKPGLHEMNVEVMFELIMVDGLGFRF